ncbi:unnamed protein product [Merluccius merluccius]
MLSTFRNVHRVSNRELRVDYKSLTELQGCGRRSRHQPQWSSRAGAGGADSSPLELQGWGQEEPTAAPAKELQGWGRRSRQQPPWSSRAGGRRSRQRPLLAEPRRSRVQDR